VTRALLLPLLLWGGLATAQTAPDGVALLQRIYQATEKLSYTGTFVYQQGDRTETSRITRVAGAGGDIERVEVLDGMPREIIRTRDVVRCYMPETQTVKVERRTDQRAFPGMLPAHVAELSRSYVIARGETKRIAGHDCNLVTLTPRDDLRYGYRLWADVSTGMLLKAQTFNRQGVVVEQFTFTQLAIGNVGREQVRLRQDTKGWRIEDAAVTPVNLAQAGWLVGTDLPGFRKVTEVQRKLSEARPVGQVVYSDGMAALSIFIEPMTGRSDSIRPGLSSLGAFHIYTREVANHVVTVVGEAPAASVQRVANTVEFRRPK
jgi:sigma-E factor negative regulatory protein RseB